MPTILFENSKNISQDKEYTGEFPVKVDNTNNKISISKATKTSLGVVTVGNGLNIDENGVISATGGTSIEIVDNLSSTATDKALSANMGKTLNDTKQDKLTAGTNITIEDNVISATGGTSIEIVDNLTSTATDKALSANMGKTLNDTKQDKLTAGSNITIENNVISATGELSPIQPATTENLGGVIVGSGLDVEANGKISLNDVISSKQITMPYTLDPSSVTLVFAETINDLCCVLPGDGKAYLTDDFTNWTTSDMPASNSFYSVRSFDNTLNALTQNNVLYTMDYLGSNNWNTENLPNSIGNITDIAGDDEGHRVAIVPGQSQYAYCGTRGGDWEIKEFTDSIQLPTEAMRITYINGYFYILNARIRSADGLVWEAIEAPLLNVEYNKIEFFKNKYFATGPWIDNKPYALISSDGLSWEDYELPTPAVNDLGYGNVVFGCNENTLMIAYAGTNELFFTKDLQKWNKVQLSSAYLWSDIACLRNDFLLVANSQNTADLLYRDSMVDAVQELLANSTGGTSTEIVDNLTSTATDKALSANMGKTLNDTKQDKLIAGTNISIDGNVISSKNTPINKFECFMKDDGIYEEVLPLKTVFSENNKIFATLCNDRVIASSDGLNWVESIKKEGITDICIANGVCAIVSPSENLVYSNSSPKDSSLWNSIDGHFTSSDDFIANHIAGNEMITIVAGIGRQQYITKKYSYKRDMMPWEDGSFPFTVGGEIIGLSFGNGLFYAVARYYADVEMQNQKLAVLSSVDCTNWNIHDVANLTAGDRSITSCKIYHNNNNETLIQIENWGYIVAVGTDSQALAVTSYHNDAGNYIGYGFGRWWSNKNEILYNTQDFVSFEKEDFDFGTSPATAVFSDDSLLVLFKNSKQVAKIQGNIQELIPATTDRLGGVIVGNGLKVDTQGVLAVNVENNLSSLDVGSPLSAYMGNHLDQIKQAKLVAGNGINIENSELLPVLTPITKLDISHTAASNNLLLCISSDKSKILTSNNGEDWNETSSNINFDFDHIATSGTAIIAMPGNKMEVKRRLLNSENWDTISIEGVGSSEYTKHLAYGNGVFVAIGDEGSIIRSDDDGVTWTKVHNYERSGYPTYRLYFANNTWFAVSDSSTNRIIISTDNGVNWSNKELTDNWKFVFSDGSNVILCGNGKLKTSSDNFDTYTDITISGMSNIIYGYKSNSRYYLYDESGRIGVSANIANGWSIYPQPKTFTVEKISSINNGRQVLVDADHYKISFYIDDKKADLISVNTSILPEATTRTKGLTKIGSGLSSGNGINLALANVVYNENGVPFVQHPTFELAGASFDYKVSSTTTDLTGKNITKLFTRNNVLLGYNGTDKQIIKSDDLGNTWHSVYTSSVQINYISFENNEYIACGKSGLIVHSVDGETWDVVDTSQSEISNKEIFKIKYAFNKYFLVDDSNYNSLRTDHELNGSFGTTIAPLINGELIDYHNQLIMAYSREHKIIVSANGNDWEHLSCPEYPTKLAKLPNGSWLGCFEFGVKISTDDMLTWSSNYVVRISNYPQNILIANDKVIVSSNNYLGATDQTAIFDVSGNLIGRKSVQGKILSSNGYLVGISVSDTKNLVIWNDFEETTKTFSQNINCFVAIGARIIVGHSDGVQICTRTLSVGS